METLTRNKVYSHYNHTDPCKHFRWTARECYQFMYARSWQQVLDFYSNVVNGRLQLSALFETKTHQVPEILEAFDDTELRNIQIGDRTGRWARVTFKIVLSYHGGSFDGWQKQPGLNTVQGLVERSLGKFIDEKKVQQLKDKCLPVEGCAIVAGRTDKGVTALQQILGGRMLRFKMLKMPSTVQHQESSESHLCLRGPPTECFVYHARAAEARLPSPDHGEGTKVMCVELVANRFLRKMVRVLVATAIREAAAGAGDDALLKLMDATCRRATAPPAPPDGLCLADVGYTEFDPHICLIF
ncbi:uncharacterized protein LOC131166419 isoform X5 [Malania oleifera]|uniref:uncharacterized protein LOC131166419 isoform X5 n=1 Tax=Malania oleifera TaxID=397392 RepID=UPI0025AE5181|nr:uncharacterized protein LOC131166419 isoform X5 [Malania oleifera]